MTQIPVRNYALMSAIKDRIKRNKESDKPIASDKEIRRLESVVKALDDSKDTMPIIMIDLADFETLGLVDYFGS